MIFIPILNGKINDTRWCLRVSSVLYITPISRLCGAYIYSLGDSKTQLTTGAPPKRRNSEPPNRLRNAPEARTPPATWSSSTSPRGAGGATRRCPSWRPGASSCRLRPRAAPPCWRFSGGLFWGGGWMWDVSQEVIYWRFCLYMFGGEEGKLMKSRWNHDESRVFGWYLVDINGW